MSEVKEAAGKDKPTRKNICARGRGHREVAQLGHVDDFACRTFKQVQTKPWKSSFAKNRSSDGRTWRLAQPRRM